MAVPVILVKERNSGVPAKTGGRILITKYGISNPPLLPDVMIRVFPSFEHSGGVSASRRQFKDFCECPLLAPLNKT